MASLSQRGVPIRAIITRGKGKVDAELLDACEGLQVVARCGVGLDNVDVDHATQLGVAVLNAPGSNSATVAEHTPGVDFDAATKNGDCSP